MPKMLYYNIFGKSTHYGKNDLFEGVRVKKNGVPKAIYNGLCEVATTN